MRWIFLLVLTADTFFIMPQLDQVHFFSQFFWLCVFFFGFYFLIVKHFLPRMARILQFRKNKLGGDAQENVGQELKLVQDSRSSALENVFTTSNKFWLHNSQRMQEWYQTRVRILNNDSLKQCNHLYIKKVGDYSLAQNAALGGVTLSAPSATFVWFLTHNLKKANTKQSENNLMQHFNKTTSGSSSKPVNKKLTRGGESQNPQGSPLVAPQSTQANANKKGKKGKK